MNLVDLSSEGLSETELTSATGLVRDIECGQSASRWRKRNSRKMRLLERASYVANKPWRGCRDVSL